MLQYATKQNRTLFLIKLFLSLLILVAKWLYYINLRLLRILVPLNITLVMIPYIKLLRFRIAKNEVSMRKEVPPDQQLL